MGLIRVRFCLKKDISLEKNNGEGLDCGSEKHQAAINVELYN